MDILLFFSFFPFDFLLLHETSEISTLLFILNKSGRNFAAAFIKGLPY